MYRAFSLTWSASMQIYWNIKENIYIYQKSSPPIGFSWIGTPTWPPFHSVLETQYGNRDVMWRSIASSTLNLNTACSINMVASFQDKECRLVYYYWKHKSDITQNIITWKKVLKQAISQKRTTCTPFHSSQHLKISVKMWIVLFCYSRTR